MPQIERVSAAYFGDVLADTKASHIIGASVASTQTDAGNTPTSTIRAGQVLSKLSTGQWVLLGYGCTTITTEATGTGDGTNRFFGTARKYVIPLSETITVGGVASTRGVDYEFDYTAGLIRFATAPAGAAAVVTTYQHLPYNSTYGTYTDDGRDIPAGILLVDTDMLGADHIAKDTHSVVVIGGRVKQDKLLATSTGLLAWAKHYLSRHGFVGIDDPVR